MCELRKHILSHRSWTAAVLLAVHAALSPSTASAGVSPQLDCPAGSIPVMPGMSIQRIADKAGPDAVICIKSGVHRTQVIRPLHGQTFIGEGRAILNGTRQIDGFVRSGATWIAEGPDRIGPRHGECKRGAPLCNVPDQLFLDDRPLRLVEGEPGPGQFSIDPLARRLRIVDDPAGHRVEITTAAVAFDGSAAGVTIRNLVIEKYASPAQRAAVQARMARGWTIEDCEIRLNSGGGVLIGDGAIVRNCDVHQNGQFGIGGVGRDPVITSNRIWRNNTRGYDFKWEAGGIKLVRSHRVHISGNRVEDNDGPGIWCDIDCRGVVIENNVVERNSDAGIFFEISFDADIRNNICRHNGHGDRSWFWGADILVAASESTRVVSNEVTVSPGGCAIMLIDQGRTMMNGRRYKTRDNLVSGNEMTFEDQLCAGGISDVAPGDESYAVITAGHNRFDGNTYRVRETAGKARFAWGHTAYDWNGARNRGLEINGQLKAY